MMSLFKERKFIGSLFRHDFMYCFEKHSMLCSLCYLGVGNLLLMLTIFYGYFLCVSVLDKRHVLKRCSIPVTFMVSNSTIWQLYPQLNIFLCGTIRAHLEHLSQPAPSMILNRTHGGVVTNTVEYKELQCA